LRELAKSAAIFLAKGISPGTLLRAAGIDGADVPDVSDEEDGQDDPDDSNDTDDPAPETTWDPALHPRDPATGRFIETGGAVAIPASLAERLIAGAAAEVSAGVFALAGGALLSLTAAGWVLAHGPKGDFQDGAGYWLPGVSNQTPSDGDGQAQGKGDNGGSATDGTNNQQSERPSKTPNAGIPGTIYKNPGSGQERTYGPDGKPLKDIDYDHDHGQGAPHQHDWVDGVRGPGKPIQ
jgi:hypothetical protein